MKILYSILRGMTFGCVILSGCTNWLEEDNKVKVTSHYIYATPDGMSRAVVALYDLERNLVRNAEGDLFAHLLFDGGTDLIFFRTGSAVQLNKLTLTASNDMVATYWTNRYSIIGKANEVIESAEAYGLEDMQAKKAWAEAKVFRARAYFDLYRRFDRLYLNTTSTTVENLNRIFVPASAKEIFDCIKKDLDDAIPVLSWTPSQTGTGTLFYGELTQAAARHVRAQVALWEKDWQEVIDQCEEIFENPNYKMEARAIDNFIGADLNSKEILLAMQFSGNIGGGNSVNNGTVVGHRMSLMINTIYYRVDGINRQTAEFGGAAWGRFYPNSYLLSLYDRNKDKRYDELFKHEWNYIFEDILPEGKHLGDKVIPTSNSYLVSLHPISLKCFDRWTNTNSPERLSSYKDIVVYRLAETYLMAAEAYMMKYGGNHAKALEYYNKTWTRAGNDYYNGPLSIDDIVDEYARELHFEGVRWPLLKRLGILGERVRLHYGDSKADDPLLTVDYTDARTAFVEPKHNYWPIPQSEIDKMGKENFPQNEGW